MGGRYGLDRSLSNQTSYPTCAAANLYTKYSSEGDSSGSNALLSRRKDMRGVIGDDGTRGDGIVPLSELVNPKQAILAMAHDNTVAGGSPFEVAEPLWLASTQGRGECGSADQGGQQPPPAAAPPAACR
eukprot:SAG25_NODE_5_length_29351_cov_43.404335_33_plen_129_part_00